MKKKTLVVGASENPDRYSYKATNMLLEYGHPIVLTGIKKGTINGEPFHLIKDREEFSELDTVTLYVSPKNQKDIMDYLIGLKPKRVIFNPGTENPDFYEKLKAQNIDYQEACTLVLLRSNQY
ncbi:MAG: CoA-binding protein [Cytophagales bacterium]|nr:CoA-binding protein [Cytophagales bacterium]